MPDQSFPDAALSHPLRRLARDDADAIAGFIAGLDADTLHARFHRAMTPAMVRAHYQTLAWDRAILLAWIAEGGIRGLAEAVLYDTPHGSEAEATVSVAVGWRGRGIGPLLLGRIATEARARGACRAIMVLNAPASPEARLVRRLGGTVDPLDRTATLPPALAVAAAGHAALVTDGLHDAGILDAQQRPDVHAGSAIRTAMGDRAARARCPHDPLDARP